MNVAIAKISVVMTLFNAERFLNEAIDSFLAQDYGNIELVAVINGISSDRTEEIVMEYARKDPRVRPIDNKVSGSAICDGLKAGFRNVTGEYFTVLDGDDRLFPGALKNLFDMAVADQSDIVVGNISQISMTGDVDGEIGLPDFSVLDRNSYLELSFWYRDFFPHGKLYRTELLHRNEITYLSVGLGTDVLLHYQLAMHARRISRLKKDIHCYRINSASISHTMTLKKNEDALEAYLFMDRLFEKSDVYEVRNAKFAFKSQGLIALAGCLLQGRANFYSRYSIEAGKLLHGDAFRDEQVRRYLKQWPYYYYVLVVYAKSYLVGNLFCYVLNKLRESSLNDYLKKTSMVLIKR